MRHDRLRYLVALVAAFVVLGAVACTREVVKEVEVPGETVVVEKEVIKVVEVPVEKIVVVEKEVIREVAASGKEKILTMSITGLTEVFCPFPQVSGLYFMWQVMFFPSLAMADGPNLKWAPNLAASWDVSADSSSYTFHIQPDAVWSDGVPITAHDVAYSFTLWLDPDIGTADLTMIKGGADYRAGKTSSVPGIVVIDDKTIRFDMETPTGLFVQKVGKYVLPLGVFPKHILDKITPADIPKSDWCKRPEVTGGPFLLQAAVPGQFVQLVANENYWFGKPKIDQIVMPIIKSPDARQIAFLREDLILPYRGGPPKEVFDDLLKDPRFNAAGAENVETVTFGTWEGSAELHDPRIRAAFIHALDREALHKIFAPLGTHIVDGMMWHKFYQIPEISDIIFPYDPDKARALLAEAGWDSNREVDVYDIGCGTKQPEFCDAMSQMFTAVGLKVNWVRTDDWVNIWWLRNTDIDSEMMFSSRTTFVDPDDWLSIAMMTGGAGAEATQYRNPEFDAKIVAGRKGPTSADRAVVYQDIARILRADLPYTTLWCCTKVISIFNTKFIHPWWKDLPQAGSTDEVGLSNVIGWNREWQMWHLEEWDLVVD
jgi:peptide/nickel transport system substrate-binding protein